MHGGINLQSTTDSYMSHAVNLIFVYKISSFLVLNHFQISWNFYIKFNYCIFFQFIKQFWNLIVIFIFPYKRITFFNKAFNWLVSWIFIKFSTLFFPIKDHSDIINHEWILDVSDVSQLTYGIFWVFRQHEKLF